MSAAVDRVMEVLADGEWHDSAELIAVLAPMMPPGPAYRRAEESRKSRQRRRGHEPTARQRGDRDSAIASGQRMAAREVLRGLNRRDRIWERDTGDAIEIRAIPDPQVR